MVTAVTRDLGIWLNLKMVLYLENLCIMEKTRIFNPKPLVAPRRWATATKRKNYAEKQHLKSNSKVRNVTMNCEAVKVGNEI